MSSVVKYFLLDFLDGGAEGCDVKLLDVVDHIGVPKVETSLLHFSDGALFIPILDNDTVDGADSACSIGSMKAMYKGRPVFWIEKDFKKIDHNFILRLKRGKWEMDYTNLIPIILFDCLFTKITYTKINDGFDPTFSKILQSAIRGLATPMKSLILNNKIIRKPIT